MGGGERNGNGKWYKDHVVPFAAMVILECMLVGGNTLYKSATATASQPLNTYVFTFYVFLFGSLFLLPSPFILYRGTSIPPIKFSVVVQISLLSLLMYLSNIFGYIGVKYSSPTLSSIMNNLSPAFTFVLAFFFRLEKVNLQSYTSQAKILGTVVSISGALIATLYNGPSLALGSVSSDWIIGGILLVGQCFLLSFTLVAQARIMVAYQVDIMVMFVFGLSGLFVAAVGGLIMVRDSDAWKLKPNVVLAAILYMGFVSGFLSVVIQIWTLRLKGPVYVAMFKPLTILIAFVMGVIFLGDSFHLGSVVGGIIISIGFYAVLWGKAKEENVDFIEATSSSSTHTTPLLQPNDVSEINKNISILV